jgi:uncharacterized protein YbjT (DUF2867 family)
MRIVVIGGSGLIGMKLVTRLRRNLHEVLPGSPGSGVDTITGAGLVEALRDTRVVVDVTDAPSFEDAAALAFFGTSSRNLLAAEKAAGVEHHLALSMVGTGRLPESGYLRAKLVQEKLIEASGIPFTILRSTQFFEFIASIIAWGESDGLIRLSPALVQPIASDDVVATLADLAIASPINGVVETGGPEKFPLDALAQHFLSANGDQRRVIADTHAPCFGATLTDLSLVPGNEPRIGPTHFKDWLRASLPQR